MPENLAQDLKELNDRGPSQVNAKAFMTRLGSHLNDRPQDKEHPDVKAQIDRFQESLSHINEAWAKAQLDVLLASRNSLASVRPASQFSHGEFFPDEVYAEKAKSVIEGALRTSGNRELYLFQQYFNNIHSSANDISIDGLKGKESITAITSHVRATQVFLNALGANIDVDGSIGTETKAAIKEYFGFDIETGAAEVVTQAIVEEIERIQSLTDAELLAALQEANANFPEKLNDKRIYISEYVRRYKDVGHTVVPNSNNKYVLTDINNNPIATELSQEDLQSIMTLLAVNGDDIFTKNMLKENIANNIFDYVVKEHDLKSSTTGNAWQAADFEVSALRTQAEVTTSKIECINNIDKKIAELRTKNADKKTNMSQKQNNLLMIQKLEIAKIFVDDRTRISDSSLTLAQEITSNREEIARALGKSETQMVELYNMIEGSDAQSLGKSMIFPMILALIGGFLSRLIPEGFMRKAFNGGIIGLLGLKAVDELNKRGYNIGSVGDASGLNNPKVTGNTTDTLSEALNTILTNAPTGLESRHKKRYAEMVQFNQQANNGGFESREQLDTAFLVLSQDPTFTSQNISALTDIDATKAATLVSSDSLALLNSKGVTNEHIKIFIRMLQEVSKETQDETVADLLVDGKDSDEINIVDITWVLGEGNIFDDENKAINQALTKISGVSYGVDESIRGNSMRAKIEEILSKTEPSLLAWFGQEITNRVGFTPSQAPDATKIQEVITALEALSGGSDQAQIDIIIQQYKNIETELTQNEAVNAYLREARAIYSIPGRAERFIDEGIEWISAWGQPLTPTNNPAITAASIAAIISSGESLLTGGSLNEDKTAQVQIAIENLRLYQIDRLDSTARDTDISQTERDIATADANVLLSDTITANDDSKELYMNTLDSLEADMAELSVKYTNVNEYIVVFNRHKENIATVQRLASLNISSSAFPNFDAKADGIYKDVFIDGFVKNYTNHVTALETDLTGLNTSPTNADDLKKSQKSFIKIRDEILLGSGDGFLANAIMSGFIYFDVANEAISRFNGEPYYDAAKAMTLALQNLDGTVANISFDISKLEDTKRALETATRSIIGDIESIPDINNAPWEDSIDISTDTGIYNAISDIQSQIGIISSVEGAEREQLDAQIAKIIDKFTTQIVTLSPVDSTTENTLNTLHERFERFIDANGIKDAGGKVFNEAKDSYENTKQRIERELTEFDYNEKLSGTTLGDLEPGQKQHITEFINTITVDRTSLIPTFASRLNGLERDNTNLYTILEVLSAISDKTYNGININGLTDMEIGSYPNLSTQDIRDNARVALRNFQLSISDSTLFSQIFTKYGSILSLRDYFRI